MSAPAGERDKVVLTTPPAASASEPPARPGAPDEEVTASGGTLWYVLLATTLAILAILWVIANEYVHESIMVGNSVPPIPSLAALLPLAGAAVIAHRIGWRTFLTHRRILLVYLLITVSAAICSRASMIFFFGYLATPQYLAATQPNMARIASLFPSWFALPVGEAARQFFEGSPTGRVPWDVWAWPLATWFVFLFLLMLTLYALLALLRKSWMEGERLTYPIVQIPMRLLGTDRQPSLFRSSTMWIGFGMAAAFDGMNMIHAFYPPFPSIGIFWDIGAYFVDRPWSGLAPMWVSYRPEIFGVAYLMPTDVLLTAWVSYLLLRLSAVIRIALGDPMQSGYYDYQEIGIGAFVCLLVILLRRAWPELKVSLAAALGRRREEENEPLSSRWAWGILLFGTLGMIVWLCAAGLPLWLAAAHLFLLIAVAIVYARIRAETGAPGIYLYPFWQQQNMLLNFFGSQGVSGGNAQALTIFASLGGLSRGYYPEICAYGAEGMNIAGRARFSQRVISRVVVAGILLGLIVGGYLYVTLAYQHGIHKLAGQYQIGLVRQQYDALNQMLATPVQPKPGLIFQTFLGGWIALLLNVMRQRLFWFPFHPIGFALASAYGFHLWAPFLVVWALKVLILRLGGDRGYRRLLPLFLGIALGRYLFAGIVWGLMGLFDSPVTRTYEIHFG